MNKKWLAAVAVAAVLGGCAAGLSACKPDDGSHTHDYSENYTASADGTTHYRKCKVDGCSSVTDLEAHKWDSEHVDNEATCTDEGSKTLTCSTCNATKNQTIDALDHEWGEWTVATEDMPTADKKGTAKRTCKRDGCTANPEEEELPELSRLNYTVANDDASCLESGHGDYSIVLKGETLTFNAETAPTGHDYSGGFTKTETEHYKACSHAGCEVKYMQGEHIWKISAAGISDTTYKYVCYTCAKEDVKEVEFKQVESGNNPVEITHSQDVNALAFYKYTAAIDGLYNFKADNTKAYVTVIVNGEIRTFGDAKGINHYLSLSAGDTVYFIFDTIGAVTLNYNISVSAPGEEANPIRLNSDIDGQTVQISLKAGEKRHYFLTGGYALYATFSEVNASLVVGKAGEQTTYTGANGSNVVIDASGLGGSVGDKTEAPAEIDGLPFYFTSTQDVTFSVKFEEKFDLGSYSMPYELLLNTDTPVSIKIVTTDLNGRPSKHGEELYFAFYPEVTGWYRFYSTAANAAIISATYDRYGDNGAGFDYTVYIDKAKFGEHPYLVQLTSANGNGAVEAEYSFKVEKAADPEPVELGVEVTASGDNKFFVLQTREDAEYIFTVSALSAGNFFTVEYPDQGTTKTLKVTEKTVKTLIKAG